MMSDDKAIKRRYFGGNSMKVIIGSVILFFILWFIFAIFDSRPSNQIVSYPAFPNTSIISHNITLVPANITVYRIDGESVISDTSGILITTNSCQIFDARNWSCTYKDASATFGFRDGDFFNFPSHQPVGVMKDFVYMSRIEYIILKCRWDFADSMTQSLACFITPFLL
jgi:hypothetical protein